MALSKYRSFCFTLIVTLISMIVAQEFVFGEPPAPTVKVDINIQDFSKPSCSAVTYRIYVSSFVSILNIILYTLLSLASLIYVRYLCHQSITEETVKSY
ncbi:envelope glycoprotein N [Elephant endotheliotropic herpesvirus 5B]|nr:envelope glycoprotein N [Elephant endotheliotropic herpesvirus 5B]